MGKLAFVLLDGSLSGKADLTPGKRCSCYDEECADVPDHLICWKGGTRLINGEVYEWDQADGYCPYLIGMKGPQ